MTDEQTDGHVYNEQYTAQQAVECGLRRLHGRSGFHLPKYIVNFLVSTVSNKNLVPVMFLQTFKRLASYLTYALNIQRR